MFGVAERATHSDRLAQRRIGSTMTFGSGWGAVISRTPNPEDPLPVRFSHPRHLPPGASRLQNAAATLAGLSIGGLVSYLWTSPHPSRTLHPSRDGGGLSIDCCKPSTMRMRMLLTSNATD